MNALISNAKNVVFDVGQVLLRFMPQEFLPQMGYEAEAETDYEIYPENGKKGLFCELWIPVKKK